MVRRLLQLVKNKLIGNNKDATENLQYENKKQDWEKRKAELMAKARQNTAANKPKSRNKSKKDHEVSAVKKQNEVLPETKKNKAQNTKRKKANLSQPHRSDNRKRKYTYKKESAAKAYTGNKEGEKTYDWNIDNFKVDPLEGKTRFHDLNLRLELMHSICEAGFQYCTPIQEGILKSTLEGKDATGKAQTGTGKTAAFLITIINKFLMDPPQGIRRPGAPRALILAPTRELVMQIAADAKVLTKYTNMSVVEIYGGMDYHKQQRRLRGNPIDILTATPGRLLDFQHKRDVFLGSVETLVIDEADRMLDMGFIPDVRKIINSTPSKSKRQTLFFSATLNGEVIRLAKLWTKDAVNVEIEPENVAGTSVNQIVYIVTNNEKFSLLFNVIQKEKLEKVLVFANRKDEAHPLQEQLKKFGISCEVLSGDVDQKKRVRTLNNFKEGRIRVLVATDVASRGIHVEDISHVINYTLPQDPEDYVHRIGRTGRAGAIGTSISFASEDDSFYIPAIEKFLGNKLPCVYPEDDLLIAPVKDRTEIRSEIQKPKEHEGNINPSRE